jgi:hypothetical protein
MGATVWFSEQDVKCQRLATKRVPATEVVKKDVLFFNFKGTSLVEKSPGLEISEPATEKHIKDYPNEYQAFLNSKEVVPDVQIVESFSEPVAEPIELDTLVEGV